MEHFSVIQSLIRTGLSGDPAGVAKQAERLMARLKKAGDEKAVQAIERILAATDEVRDLEPSRVEVSRALIVGEQLTESVHPPIDRETGARLCEIILPRAKADAAPVLTGAVHAAVDGILSEWRGVDRLHKMGVEPTRTLLIFGPPGSGKTMTAQYIASALNLPLITARIDGLISSYLGTTARNIANLFDFANRYASILLLDEFDAIAKLRDDPQEIGEIKRVVNTLLQNLDLRKGIGVTIAITNHDRLLDPAVWRRFETQIHMDAPDYNVREQLIRRYLKPIPASADLVTLFTYCLRGMSGADLERLCGSVKRIVAVEGKSAESPALFAALTSVLERLPNYENDAMNLLARNPDWFVSMAANDPDLKLTQEALGAIVGKSQYQISRLKSDKPYLNKKEAVNA